MQNYELYFMDYLDGNLNPDEISELFAFLALYPHKKEELEAMQGAVLPGESKIFENKNALKKTIDHIDQINENNFDEFCIAKLEGDLSLAKLQQYQAYVKQHPEKQHIEEVFKKTHLKADEAVFFPKKNKLKKFDIKVFRRKFALYSSTVAAAVLLVFGMVQLFTDRSEPQITSTVQPTRESSSPMPEPEQPEISNPTIAENERTELNHAADEQGNLHSENKSMVPKEIKIQNEQKSKFPDKTDGLEKLAAISPSFEQPSWKYDIHTGMHTKTPTKYVNDDADGFLTLPQLAVSKLNQKVKAIPADSLIEKTIPEIAETGLQRLYAVIEKEITIEKETDEEGKRRSFSLNTKYFSFYTTKTRN